VKLRAPFDAQTLMRKLGMPPRDIPLPTFAPRRHRPTRGSAPPSSRQPKNPWPRRPPAVKLRRTAASASRPPAAAGSRR
jgi:hypothetical protein